MKINIPLLNSPSYWLTVKQTNNLTIYIVDSELRDSYKEEAKKYYLINYKYITFITYKILYKLKNKGLQQESEVEMSNVNNFGIWNKIILMDVSESHPTIKSNINYRDLISISWLKRSKFSQFQDLRKVREVHKFLSRINVSDYLEKQKII